MMIHAKKTVQYCIPCCIALLLFCYVCDLYILDPQNIRWLSTGDSVQHYLGWIFYRDAPWTFPLGNSPNWGLELASSVAYSDALPLFAIPFKLFRAFEPAVFQYFGLWFLCCFLLQACLGWRILTLLSLSLPSRIFGTFFLAFSPIMIVRMSAHQSLAGQFLVLWSFVLYLNKDKRRLLLGWNLCLVTSLLVHPYFTFMLLPIFLADMYKRYWKTKRKKGLQSLVCCGVCLLLTAWQLGLLSSASDPSASAGYGFFRLNLNAFFNPMFFHSRFFPTYYDDYCAEGFAYLGIAIFVLFFITILSNLRNKEQLKQIFTLHTDYRPLFLAVLLLFCFAVSSYLSFYEYVWKIFEGNGFSLCKTFRASGRFVWPLYYLIIIYVLYIVDKYLQCKQYQKICCLCLCAVLQISDFKPLIASTIVHNTQPVSSLLEIKENHTRINLHYDLWQKLAQKYHTIRVLHNPGRIYAHWEEIAYICALNHLQTNAMYLERNNEDVMLQRFDRDAELLLSGNFDPQTIYVFDVRHLPLLVKLQKQQNFALVRLDHLNLILPDGKELVQRLHLQELDSSTLVQICLPAKRYATSLKGQGFSLLYAGWQGAEEWGTWSRGKKAQILLQADRKINHIYLDVHALVTRRYPVQRMEICVNGHNLGVKAIDRLQTVVLPIKDLPDNHNHLYTISLQFPDATSPVNLGINYDVRELAIGLHAVSFD